MKSEAELQQKVTELNSEIQELITVQDHCATNKWWSVVTEIKKLKGIRMRERDNLESILS